MTISNLFTVLSFLSYIVSIKAFTANNRKSITQLSKSKLNLHNFADVSTMMTSFLQKVDPDQARGEFFFFFFGGSGALGIGAGFDNIIYIYIYIYIL